MSAITFKEYRQLEEDQIIKDFLIENGCDEKELEESWGLVLRSLGTVGGGIRLLLWNARTKAVFARLLGPVISGTTLGGMIIGSAAALAALLCSWLTLSLPECAKLAEILFYTGMTVLGALLALLGRRASLKVINWINKEKIHKQVQKLEKKKKMTKADLAQIKEIAKKYNLEKSLDKQGLAKFKKKYKVA